MAATRSNRRAARPVKRAGSSPRRRVRPVKPVVKAAALVPVQVLYRFCKPSWAVIVEKTPHAQGTRFVCPFCPRSHRVPGPVRGFQKIRRPRWIKLRWAEE